MYLNLLTKLKSYFYYCIAALLKTPDYGDFGVAKKISGISC